MAAAIDRGIGARAAVKHIITCTAGERVIPAVAGERVVGAVPGYGVVARTADGVFDHRGRVDADVADETADIGEAAASEIDDLVLAVAGRIERIGTAGIKNGQRR